MFDIFGGGKNSRRKYISKADEDKILERQKWKCARCGKTLKPGRYHIDHKKPLALGGSNSIRNLQALCPNCHHVKTKEDRKKIAKAKKKEKEDILGFGLSLTGKKKKKDPFAIDIPEFKLSDPLGGGKRRRGKKRKKKKSDDILGFDLF